MIRLIATLAALAALTAFSPQKDREISADALEITSRMKEGDVLMIHSNDFFSRFVRSVDNCKQSSFKLVVVHENQVQLLVSDADNISDNTQGLRLNEPIGYLNDYGSLSIKLMRPLEFTEKAKAQIREYIERSQREVVSYDFSYFKNEQDRLTCEKVVATVHEKSFKRTYLDHPFFMTYLPCDFDESQFEELSDWTDFFAKK